MVQISKFNFHGDELEVCGTCREDAHVSIRRVCEVLGIDSKSQIDKLRGKAWATVVFNTSVAEDGKERQHAMIALKTLPMWLATIDTRKAKRGQVEKIELYQQQAHDVLAAHFLGIGKPATGVTHAELNQVVAPILKALNDLGKVVANLVDQQDQVIEHLERHQQQIDRINALLPSAGGLLLGQPLHAIPQATVQDRLSHLGWHEASAKHRERVRRRANAWLMMRYGQTPDVSGGPGGGGPCVYYGPQISVLDEAIRREWADALRREQLRERVTGPTLFTGVTG